MQKVVVLGCLASVVGDPPTLAVDRCRYSYTERKLTTRFVKDETGPSLQAQDVDIVYDDQTEEEATGRWETVAENKEVKGTHILRIGGITLMPRAALSPTEWKDLGYRLVYADPSRQRHAVFDGPPIRLRSSVQTAAVAALRREECGILELAPGKGKTVMALAAAQAWGEPTLIFVHNGSLFEQWVERIVEHYQCSDSDVGRIQGQFATWTWSHRGICVAMLQSFISELEANRVPAEFFDRFGTVVWDEVHHAKAATYSTTLPLFSSRRIGLSATPNLEGKESVYFTHIGRPVYRDLKFDVTPTYRLHTFNVPAWRAVNSKHALAYNKLLDQAFAKPSERKSAGQKVLRHAYLDQVIENVLIPLREAGRRVVVIAPRTMAGAYIKGKMEGVGEIRGSVPAKKRASILANHDITVVTRIIGEEGIDYPPLTDTVYLTPVGVGGSNSLRQGAGRLGRLSEGKTDACIHVCSPVDGYGLALLRSNAQALSEMGIHPDVAEASTTVQAPVRKRAKRDVRPYAESALAFLKPKGKP